MILKTPVVDIDVGNRATFTKVARLTIDHATNKVKLTSFTLDTTGRVTAQKELQENTLAAGQSVDFSLDAAHRGVLSRAYAYWHTTYPPHFVAPLGVWPQPFPLEYAGYPTSHDATFFACKGYGGTIARRNPMITVTMASKNVPPGTNSVVTSVWNDNSIVNFVLWLEQNQGGTATLAGRNHVI